MAPALTGGSAAAVAVAAAADKKKKEVSFVERALACSLRRECVVAGLRESLLQTTGIAVPESALSNACRRVAVLNPLAEAVTETLYSKPRKSPRKLTRRPKTMRRRTYKSSTTTESDTSHEEGGGDKDDSPSSEIATSSVAPRDNDKDDHDNTPIPRVVLRRITF